LCLGVAGYSVNARVGDLHPVLHHGHTAIAAFWMQFITELFLRRGAHRAAGAGN
jgi:hypothetical protein